MRWVYTYTPFLSKVKKLNVASGRIIKNTVSQRKSFHGTPFVHYPFRSSSTHKGPGQHTTKENTPNSQRCENWVNTPSIFGRALGNLVCCGLRVVWQHASGESVS